MRMQAIKDALQHGPMSTVELAEMLKEKRENVNKDLRRLRDRREVYISYYERQPEGYSGAFVPYYRVGKHQDASKPELLSCKERARVYRQRNKALIMARRRPDLVSAMGVWSGLGSR